MTERTEDEKITQGPITVVLGGKEHKVKLLVIKDSRQWRAEVVKLLATLPQYITVTTDDPEAFGGAMNAMISSMPDTVIDLFFKYAKDLNQEEMEAVASDAEVAAAFEKVVSVAFPLVGSLTTLTEKLSP